MKLKSVKIVLTFFLLWVTTQFDSNIEDYLAYTFILSLGVLHGSNDLKLVKNLDNFKISNYKRILLMYIGVVFTTFIIFLIIPKIALILFILISGYHFGEQHLAQKALVKSKVRNLVFLLYGLLIFFMIFYTNFESVLLIIQDIVAISISQQLYTYSMLITLIVLSITIAIFKSKNLTVIIVLEELGNLALFYILFINSTLLWSFAIYFIVWHSIPSLKDQIVSLYGTVSFNTILKYMKDSFLYWIVSIIGIFALSVFAKEDEQLFNLLFVALLSAITFPHVIILGKMHK